MNQYGNYTPQRTDMKKKKRINTILNLSIGIVALLIVFISATLIFGGESDESAVSDNSEVDETAENDNEIGEESETDNQNNDTSNGSDTVPGDERDDQNETDSHNNSTNDSEEQGNATDEQNSDSDSDGDSEWAPIGTVQEEPFAAVYEQDHVNWQEMTQALQYATGLDGENMIIWRIRNGGDHVTAVGTVSTYENRNEPYKVILSWVENSGWMPISVEENKSNPYKN